MMDRRRALKCIEMTKAIQEKNCHAVLRLLDEESFDVDSELMLHKHPITVSIESNALAIGRLLVSRGCSLSLKNGQGLTPLLLAVQQLNFDFVKLLMDNRADLTSQDNGGRTALHLAAEMNSLRMVQLLLRNSSEVLLKMSDKEGRTPLSYACAYGSKSLITYFLERGGSDVNKACGAYADTPLLTLISNFNCSLHSVTLLVDAGANVNHVNKVRETPLLKAVHKLEDWSLCEVTLVGPHKTFHDICTLLVARGGKVNVSDSVGNTPLHIAVTAKDSHLVHTLLNAGSYVNATNNLGLTPLFYACKKGLLDIATMLLDCGANAEVMDYFSHHYQWLLNNENLLYPNTCSVLSYIFRKSRECRDLQSACRLIIRKNLKGRIDESASMLPLPSSLVKFILLC